MKRDFDIWRWMIWGTLIAIACFLGEIAQQLKYIAAAHY